MTISAVDSCPDFTTEAIEAAVACASAKPLTSAAISTPLCPKTDRSAIAASGMATGGRVLHHLKALAPNPRNTLLFFGFQAGGTRGADITAGVRTIRVHGEDVPMKSCSGCEASRGPLGIPLWCMVNPMQLIRCGAESALSLVEGEWIELGEAQL